MISDSLINARCTERALGWVQENINRQAGMLCYMDCFRPLMWVSLALAPVALFFVVGKHPARTDRAPKAKSSRQIGSLN
jgi:hypothetical protein